MILPETSAPELGFLSALVVICVTAAYLDIGKRTLPNWLCGVTLVVGLVASFTLGGSGVMISALVHAVIALLVGMGLFSLGVIGGGDAKFYAAIAAWFALEQALFLLVSVTVSGLLLVIVWFLFWCRKTPITDNGDSNDPMSKLPYGVAISLGACLSLIFFVTRA